jgi:hypothetical protein
VANTITEVLPKLLAQGLLALRQNAVLPRLVNRSYDNLAAQKGNVINVPIPAAIAARDVTPAVSYAANVDTTQTSAQVTLDFWKEAPFQLSDNDLVSAMDGVIPMQASEAVKSLGNAVDAYIWGKHIGIYGMAGTPGTTPFNGSLVAAGTMRKLMNLQLAPMDDRRAVIDPSAEANLLIVPNILDTDKRGDQGGILEGSIGRKLGFDWFMDQNAVSYTPGTGWASGNIASTVAGVIGQTTLNIINATASGQIKIGDIFTVTGDTSNGGGAQQYVVTVTTTISATVQVVITFQPPLKATVATGATLVVVSATYVANLAFHRDAFAWASRPLADVQGLGHAMMSAVDPISGVTLRLEVSRQYKQTTFSYDVLGGANLVRRDLAVKIAG